MIPKLPSLKPPTAWQRKDVLASSFFINLLGLALPIMILQVYDRIIPQSAFGTLSALVVVISICLLFEVILRVLRTKILSSVGARYQHKTSVAAFTALLKSDNNAFNKENATVYAERMNNVGIVRDFYTGQAATLAIDLPFAFLFLALIMVIGGSLVLVPLTLLAVLVGIVMFMGERLTEALKTHKETDKRRHNFLVETLQGIHTVKSLGMERMMLRRHERLQERSAQEVINLSQLHAMSLNLATTFSQLAMVSYVVVGSFSVISQNMTLGGLAAGTMLTGRVLQPVLRGLNFWIRFQSVQIAEEELEKLFNIEAESGQDLEDVTLTGQIELQNVSFRYNEESPWILKNVSLEIPAGSSIGFTGGNGCGLSTFFGLINGTLKPTEGRVLVDGQDLQGLNLESVRKQMGYMPEHGELFSGTILENLTKFREGDVKKRAVDTLRLLGLDDIVVRMPKGLDTPLGGSIVNALPTGTQQQFVIARALVDNPPIILFDNAHSGLDREGDTLLREALLKIRKDKTLLIGTFRPSFLNFCDRTYVLTNGNLEKQKETSTAPAKARTSTFQQLKELSDQVAERSGRGIEEPHIAEEVKEAEILEKPSAQKHRRGLSKRRLKKRAAQ